VICRLTGRLLAVAQQTVEVEVGGLAYEVFLPSFYYADLISRRGETLTLFTVQYLEGNPAGGNLTPRLLGFLNETHREFFSEFVKVKGVSMRRALRAMHVPPHLIAAAIERGDEKFLTGLPEIGKKTAAQIVTDLRGQMQPFAAAAGASAAAAGPIQLTNAQLVALDIMVQWGDRRPDAQRWIAEAVEADPALSEPDAIVRAAYRVKQRG
jgi:Holliday junction DNA helicase RuvA